MKVEIGRYSVLVDYEPPEPAVGFNGWLDIISINDIDAENLTEEFVSNIYDELKKLLGKPYIVCMER